MTYSLPLALVSTSGLLAWAVTAPMRNEDDEHVLMNRIQESRKKISIKPLDRSEVIYEDTTNSNYLRQVFAMGRGSSARVTLCWRLQQENPQKDEYLEMCVEALLIRLCFLFCIWEFAFRSGRKLLSSGPVYLPLFVPCLAANICDHMDRTIDAMIDSYRPDLIDSA